MQTRFRFRSRTIFPALASAIAAGALLAGCGAGSLDTTVSAPVTSAGFTGRTMGGETPISGARIRLFQAGSSGYGTGATELKTGTPVYSAVGTGQFNFPTGTLGCTSNTSQVYLTATGGDPTGMNAYNATAGSAFQTANNATIKEVVLLGNCGNINDNTFVVMNELTTVAAAYAAGHFAADSTSTNSGTTSYGTVTIGTSSSNAQGLQDAFSTAALLVPSFGNTAGASTANVVLPTAMLNTLGNVLVQCVNSTGNGTGPSSTPCTNLISYATTPGGSVPSDTFQMMQNIAAYPGNNVASILAVPTNNAFGSNLPAGSASSGTVANDLSLGIEYVNTTYQSDANQSFYSGGSSSSPNLTIDGSDNVWVVGYANGTGTSNYNYIGELTSASNTPAYTSTLGSVPALTYAHTIRNGAFDTQGNLWLSDKNATGGSVIELPFANAGAAVEETAFNNALDPNDWIVALDAAQDIWTASYGGQGNCSTATSGTECSYVEYVNNNGTFSSYSPIYQFGSGSTQENTPTVRGIAVDTTSTAGKGNVWTANYGTFSGVASAPGTSVEILTPGSGTIAASLATVTIGSGTYAAGSPFGVALDKNGNGFVTTTASLATSGLFEVPQGTATSTTIANPVPTTNQGTNYPNIATTATAPATNASTSPAIGGLNGPGYVAIDGAGNAFVANFKYGSVAEYSTSGGAWLSPFYGYAPSLTFTGTAGGSTVAVTFVSLSTANQANIYGPNNVTYGQSVTFSNFPAGTYGTLLNGKTYTVISAGASYFSVSTPGSAAGAGKTATTGTAVATSSQANFNCPSGSTTCGVYGTPLYSNNSIAIDRSGTVWTLSTSGSLLGIIGLAAPTNPVLSAGAQGTTP